MELLDEKLYFYYISLKTSFVSLENYNKWLNEAFADYPQNETLLALEWCSENVEKTIEELRIYSHDKLTSLDYREIWKMIIETLRVNYAAAPDSLEEIASKLYDVWAMLPEEIAHKEPFIALDYVQTPFAYGAREEVRKGLNQLMDSL
jgi:hypothetical protein